MRRDDRLDHVQHVAAGQIVGFQSGGAHTAVAVDVQSRLRAHDLGHHDLRRFHLP
jgi:hypothetical protein